MAQDLVAFLHETADRFGAKTALLMKLGIRYRTWSYDDMWAESGRVASLLQAKGVQPGDRVAIWGPNSPQWVFAFFGSMRAGAIPVPIDLRSDEQFVARIAEKSRPTMGFAPGAGSALGVDIVLLEAAGGTGHRDRHQSLHQRGVEQWFRHQTAQLRCDGGWGVQGHAWLLDRCNRRLQFLLRWNRWRPAWPVLRAERTQYS